MSESSSSDIDNYETKRKKKGVETLNVINTKLLKEQKWKGFFGKTILEKPSPLGELEVAASGVRNLNLIFHLFF